MQSQHINMKYFNEFSKILLTRSFFEFEKKSCDWQYFKKYSCVCSETWRKREIPINDIPRFPSLDRQKDLKIQKSTRRSYKAAIASASWRTPPWIGRRSTPLNTTTSSIWLPHRHWNREISWRTHWTSSGIRDPSSRRNYRETASYSRAESVVAAIRASPQSIQRGLWEISKANQQGIH